MKKLKPWMILLPLLVGSIAYAQYLQSGPYSEPHTAVSNGCVEVRADMGGGWSQMCVGTAAGQLAAGDDARFVPVGTIVMYGGTTAPSGWALLNGGTFLRSAPLFAIFGTTFGAGDGSTTANLPDFRQRFPLGKAAAGTGSTLGATGGAIDHTHGSPLTTSGPSATIAATNLLTTAASPTHTHNVTVPGDNPPYLVINYIVKT